MQNPKRSTFQCICATSSTLTTTLHEYGTPRNGEQACRPSPTHPLSMVPSKLHVGPFFHVRYTSRLISGHQLIPSCHTHSAPVHWCRNIVTMRVARQTHRIKPDVVSGLIHQASKKEHLVPHPYSIKSADNSTWAQNSSFYSCPGLHNTVANQKSGRAQEFILNGSVSMCCACAGAGTCACAWRVCLCLRVSVIASARVCAWGCACTSVPMLAHLHPQVHAHVCP